MTDRNLRIEDNAMYSHVAYHRIGSGGAIVADTTKQKPQLHQWNGLTVYLNLNFTKAKVSRSSMTRAWLRFGLLRLRSCVILVLLSVGILSLKLGRLSFLRSLLYLMWQDNSSTLQIKTAFTWNHLESKCDHLELITQTSALLFSEVSDAGCDVWNKGWEGNEAQNDLGQSLSLWMSSRLSKILSRTQGLWFENKGD